jgi:hypothetical protein
MWIDVVQKGAGSLTVAHPHGIMVWFRYITDVDYICGILTLYVKVIPYQLTIFHSIGSKFLIAHVMEI